MVQLKKQLGKRGKDTMNYEKEHIIQCGGAKIHCYESGSGEPVVLLHGNGEDSGYWENQRPVLLRAGYRVIAMDSRGHGQSEAGWQGLSFALFAEDLRTVLDALGVERAHIIGFSDGGNLALKFALMYPRYVDRLVLNGANIEMLGGVSPSIQLPLYPIVGALALAGRVSAEAKHKHDVLALMTKDYGVTWDGLRTIEAPALVIVGEHDMIRDAHSRRIAETLKDGTFCRIDGAGHFCAAEAPARFNLSVLRFLKDMV